MTYTVIQAERAKRGEGQQMVAVLIAENDPMTRALVEMFVRQSGTYRVAASICCEQLFPQVMLESGAELVLLGTSNFVNMEWLKERFPAVKLIAMTSQPEYGCMAGARACGADSFWYQQPNENELIQLMNRTMEGESIYPPQMIAHLGDALSSDFTDREIQVLREVVAGRTDAEIAERLGISLRTVKGHIQNLREKTGYRNRTELAVNARSSGLIVR